MSRRGFSLAEALIAMAIGSLLLIGACRFLPALQRHILRRGEQLAWRTNCGSGCMPWVNICSAPDTAGERAAEPDWSLPPTASA